MSELRWTGVNADTGDAEDTIWRIIHDRIYRGYSGLNPTREADDNADVRAAIVAIRAQMDEDVRRLVLRYDAALGHAVYRTHADSEGCDACNDARRLLNDRAALEPFKAVPTAVSEGVGSHD